MAVHRIEFEDGSISEVNLKSPFANVFLNRYYGLMECGGCGSVTGNPGLRKVEGGVVDRVCHICGDTERVDSWRMIVSKHRRYIRSEGGCAFRRGVGEGKYGAFDQGSQGDGCI